MELGIDAADALVDVTLELKRVGPLKKDRMRTVVFAVNGKEQHVEVKNPAAEGEFDGPMADPADATHVPAPMPGAIEKVFVADGATVAEGDDLFIVCAMKMEVAVKAPRAGKISGVAVALGDKVVESALLCKLA